MGSGCTACARACCRGVDPATLARCRVARPEVSGARLLLFIILLAVPPPPPCPATCQPLPSGGGHEDGGSLQPDPDLGPVPCGCCCSPPPSGRVLSLPLLYGAWFPPARPADHCAFAATRPALRPGHDCDKCSRACPRASRSAHRGAQSRVHQLPELRGRLPQRTDVLHLGTQGQRPPPPTTGAALSVAASVAAAHLTACWDLWVS